MPTLNLIPVQNLFGFKIHALTMQETLDVCQKAIETKQPVQIGVVNAAKLVNMRKNPSLRRAVVDSDIVLADGMAVVWASRVLRRPLPERVAGIDLFTNLMALANREGFSAYLLGATQEVVEKVVEKIEKEYGGAKVAGFQNGYFSMEDAEEVAEKIKKARPDMLFVAMSSPKKELFLEKWGPQMTVSVCHGVGGSFDVLAGVTKRAPRIWQKLGLEWLYRLLQEPRRMCKRYLVTNTLFIWIVLRELFSRKKRE